MRIDYRKRKPHNRKGKLYNLAVLKTLKSPF